MTLEPLNGIPLISEASKSKLYAFSLGSDRIRLITLSYDRFQPEAT